MTSQELFAELERIARKDYDGHFTIMRFTGNWRVGFGTPADRYDIQALAAGSTFEEAVTRALVDPAATQDRIAAVRGLRGAGLLPQEWYEQICAEEAELAALAERVSATPR
jgi:hypothetical protein